jgi:ribosomal protein S18 acetylase RimI-like enzyme
LVPGYDRTVSIREATTADAAVLAELARRTFYDTFAPTNDAGDMALHLARAYGVSQQTAELSDPALSTLLVEQDGVAIAYAQLRIGHVPQCITGADPIELWRFYVSQEWHGRGIAQRLMERVKADARRRGARTLWLGVWEKNDRARAFYAKCGFTDAGEHIFLFGTDPQTDRVMVAPLEAPL